MQEFSTQRFDGGQEPKVPMPWQVSISNHYCGGTILDSKTVLSAAQCFYSGYADRYYVVASARQKIGISKLVTNPDKPFNISTKDYDIVLLKLQHEISFEEGVIQPACLPEVNFIPSNGTKCFASGWGHYDYYNQNQHDMLSPYSLSWVEAFIVDQNECIRQYQHHESITDNMICASDEEGKYQFGGAVVCLDGDVPVVIGVANIGYHNYPGIFARVAPHLDWIKANMENNGNSNG